MKTHNKGFKQNQLFAIEPMMTSRLKTTSNTLVFLLAAVFGEVVVAENDPFFDKMFSKRINALIIVFSYSLR